VGSVVPPRPRSRRRTSAPAPHSRAASAPPFDGPDASPWFEATAHEDALESPLVTFVNPRSDGRLDPVLKTLLQELIGEDQVNTHTTFSLSHTYL
jgi:hypothetical protein